MLANFSLLRITALFAVAYGLVAPNVVWTNDNVSINETQLKTLLSHPQDFAWIQSFSDDDFYEFYIDGNPSNSTLKVVAFCTVKSTSTASIATTNTAKTTTNTAKTTTATTNTANPCNQLRLEAVLARNAGNAAVMLGSWKPITPTVISTSTSDNNAGHGFDFIPISNPREGPTNDPLWDLPEAHETGFDASSQQSVFHDLPPPSSRANEGHSSSRGGRRGPTTVEEGHFIPRPAFVPHPVF